jgi:PAS domain S-box-containing protein
LLFKTSPIGIFHYDANLRITALNERFAAILRTSADKLEWFDMNMLKDKRVLPAIQQALDGKPGFYEGMYTSTLSPCDIWISLHTAPIIESGGEINGAIAIVEDKTDRHKLEEHLRHSQKIEAIGQLAGGVAHDFNNILSAIVGYADLALMKLSKDDALRGNIEQILRASGRAAALTRGLLSFSRRQVIIPGTLDLNEIVKKQENFLARLIREDIDIRTTYAKCPLPIFADSGQLEAVLMNLVTNARDAMPKGGVIEIRTERATLGEDFIAAHGGGTAGRYAGVIVSDTGEGIDESIISKIFDPFFTTKEQGQGTGLGLSMVYGTVRQHNGYIDVSSERGIGSTFKVYLPLYKTAHKEVSGQAEPDALPRGSETILIAEDDAPLRDLFSTVLENHGYRVIVATDGDEAIIKYNENQDAVKLIILDGIMPKKSGIRAYREIRIINPSVKVLFVSGYAEEIINKEGLLDLDINLLRKPFTPGVLLTRIRELLDGGVCG